MDTCVADAVNLLDIIFRVYGDEQMVRVRMFTRIV